MTDPAPLQPTEKPAPAATTAPETTPIPRDQYGRLICQLCDGTGSQLVMGHGRRVEGGRPCVICKGTGRLDDGGSVPISAPTTPPDATPYERLIELGPRAVDLSARLKRWGDTDTRTARMAGLLLCDLIELIGPLLTRLPAMLDAHDNRGGETGLDLALGSLGLGLPRTADLKAAAPTPTALQKERAAARGLMEIRKTLGDEGAV